MSKKNYFLLGILVGILLIILVIFIANISLQKKEIEEFNRKTVLII